HNGQQSDLTWKEVEQHSFAIARRLLALNVEVQENIGLFAHNSMNWALVDLAVLQLKAVTVPLYATSSVEQAAYI
ncbi:AMP-binding protein, partial [Escherichia coli]